MKSIIFCLILTTLAIAAPPKIDWETWLPMIRTVESSNLQYARSWRGEKYGRGYYMISEVLLIEFQNWVPKTTWITPSMLYNPKINHDIAIWYLWHLDDIYRNREDKFFAVLSAYSGGPTLVNNGWRDWDYINQVMMAVKGR